MYELKSFCYPILRGFLSELKMVFIIRRRHKLFFLFGRILSTIINFVIFFKISSTDDVKVLLTRMSSNYNTDHGRGYVLLLNAQFGRYLKREKTHSCSRTLQNTVICEMNLTEYFPTKLQA